MSVSENGNFDLERLAKLIRQAPGPSTWYYGQQPPFPSDVGLLSWKQLHREGSVALVDTQGNYRLILSFYSYAMPISQSRILVWYEAGEPPQPLVGIDIFLLEIADLTPLEKTTAEARMPRRQGPKVIFNAVPVASVMVPASLKAGLNRFVFPAPFKTLPEILVLGNNASIPGTSMKRSIYCLRPKDGDIEVLPQDWFNLGNFDFGYQWITKVVRDPHSGRISGTGIRLKSFILDESGRQVEREFE
ncbi:MAG: hypothetical protein WBQ86_14445 [Candidatus Binatus sp.]